MNKFAASYPFFSYLDRLSARCVNLQRALTQIKSSPVWRWSAPLRFVDDYLRRLRRKKHLRARAVVQHAE
jgi:hypothetical protein